MHKKKTVDKLYEDKSCFNSNVDAYVGFNMKSVFSHLIAREPSYGENKFV